MNAVTAPSRQQVATQQQAPVPVATDIRKMQSQFALALPDHVSPEKFVRVVVTAIQSNPDLARADRDSILGAALKCAQDGLLPDGREAALVVYGSKAQYMPMIAGVLAKVRRSGEMSTLGAHVVYEQDAFTYTLGDEEKIEHQPFLSGARGKPIAVYAIAKTKDGGIYREVMSVEQVNQVRNVSKAKNAGPWVQWWDEMARKTVLRRLSKRLPMSTDLQQVFERDNDHYDLRQAAHGEATIRRLHADFDEPAPKADDVPDAPIEDIQDAVIEDAPPADAPASEPKKATKVRIGTVELPTLADHVTAFKTACQGKSTTALSNIWRSDNVKGLLSALEAADPDVAGETPETLETWFNCTFTAQEDVEKGGAQ